ncbi:hypothetical protein DFJ63DRAFT_335183 [Scheffersomyces coipomensis]|uniref:uncharacterized protein n=1 Tax=Scheffersomyces coipomensis TaxID=1788519 RepID=UPI00315C8F93
MDDLNIARLMEMGFSRENAIDALHQSQNDLEKAISFLFGDHTIVGDNFPPDENDENTGMDNNHALVLYDEDTVNIRNPEDIPISKLQQYSHNSNHESKALPRPPPPPPPPPPPQPPAGPPSAGPPSRGGGEAKLYATTILKNKKQFIDDIETNSADNYDIHSGMNEELDDEDDEDEEDSIYEKVQNYARIDNFPPVILNQTATYLENYIIPLIVILSQYDKFKYQLLKPDHTHFNYGYSKQWFQHDSDLSIDIPDQFKTGESSLSYRFMIEIQRLFAFLLPDYSKRSFMSGQILLNQLPTEFNYELNNDRIEDIEDLIKKFYHILNSEYDKVFKSETDQGFMHDLFTSTIESIRDDDIEEGGGGEGSSRSGISVIPIDYDTRSRDLFSTISSMFWNDEIMDDESIGSVRFDDISPIITFQLSGDDEGFQTQPFKIDEYFYPELFSSKYIRLIREMNFKKKKLVESRNSLTQNILSFNSFEGKPIKKILNHSLEFLKTIHQDESDEGEIVQDLTNLTDSIRHITTDLTTELHSLSSKNLQYDIKNCDQILKYIESNLDDHLSEMPKRYILTGVITSDTEYFYKVKTKKSQEEEDVEVEVATLFDWVHVTCFTNGMKKVIDFTIDYIEFSSVQQAILQFSKDKRRQFVFIYIDEESFNESYEFKLSDELNQFFKQDNENLEELLKLNKVFNDDEEGEDDDDEKAVAKNDEVDDLIDLESSHVENKENKPESSNVNVNANANTNTNDEDQQYGVEIEEVEYNRSN